MRDSSDSETRPGALWTAIDAARFLKVSRSWIYQRAEAGELPCLRIGGLIRFDPEAVRAFARGNRKPPTILPFSTSPSGKSG